MHIDEKDSESATVEHQSSENLIQPENMTTNSENMTMNSEIKTTNAEIFQVSSSPGTDENLDEKGMLTDLDEVDQENSSTLLQYFELAAAQRGRRTAPLATADEEDVPVALEKSDLDVRENNPIPTKLELELEPELELEVLLAKLKSDLQSKVKERTWTETEVDSFSEREIPQISQEIQIDSNKNLEPIVTINGESEVSEDTKSLDSLPSVLDYTSVEMEWDSVKSYDVAGPVRGKVLILQMCNFSYEIMTEYGVTTRPEAEADGRDLKFRLRHAGFHVQLVKDPNREEVLSLIADYTSQEKMETPPSFFLIVMTHTIQPKGVSKVALAFYDSFIFREELINPFVKCQFLNGKPKIFIFQACKNSGKSENFGGILMRSGSSMRRTGSMRSQSKFREENSGQSINQSMLLGPDLLILESNISGFWSFKNAKSGTWFIQLLATALDFNVVNPKVDFVKLLVRLNGQMAAASVSSPTENPNGGFDPQRPSPAWTANNYKRKPTVVFMSTLTKLLYIY